MEQPDVVFSVEQVHCDRSEASSPAPDGDTALKSDPDPETSGKLGNVGSSPSSSAELCFEPEEKPEQLLQLAPEAGDVVPLTGETLFSDLSSNYKRIMFYLVVYFRGRLSPPSGRDGYYTNKNRHLHEPAKSSANDNKSTGEMGLLCIKFAFLLFSEVAELSFLSPSSPNMVPENPQDLCSPQLLQLLTPIFSPMTPPPSSPSSESDAEPVDESLH